jgi:ankyrin repeat protein
MRAILNQLPSDDLNRPGSLESSSASHVSDLPWEPFPYVIELLPCFELRGHLERNVSYFPGHFLVMDLISTIPSIQKGRMSSKPFQGLTRHKFKDLSDLDIADAALRLISNNHMDEVQSAEFLRGFAKSMPVSLIKSIMCLRTPMVQALTAAFLEVAVTHWWTDVLRLLVACEIDLTLLRGLKGGRLLQLALFSWPLPNGTFYNGAGERGQIVDFLLLKGADVNPALSTETRASESSPLLHALRNQYLGEAKTLLRAGACMPLEMVSAAAMSSTIEAAIRYGDAECVELCIQAGADVENQEIDRIPALLWAFCRNERTFDTLYITCLPNEEDFSVLNILLAAQRGFVALDNYLMQHEIDSDWKMQVDMVEALCRSIEYLSLDEQVKVRIATDIYITTNIVDIHTPEETHVAKLLEAAIEFGETEVIKTLLARGLETLTLISTWIHNNVYRRESVGPSAGLALFIDLGIDMNTWGSWLLCKAARVSNPKDCQLLIENGASVHRTGQDGLHVVQSVLCGNSPFTHRSSTSTDRNRAEILRMLFEAGAEINSLSVNCQYSPLHLAARMGNAMLFDLLLSKGAHIVYGTNHSDCENPLKRCESVYADVLHTSRHIELDSNREAILYRLLGMGIPLRRACKISGRQHASVLVRAIQLGGSIQLIEKLINFGADVNEYDYSLSDETPLQAAARKSGIELIRYLLSKGGNINAPAGNMYGGTVLQFACHQVDADLDMVKFLLDQKADVNALPSFSRGFTALQGAAISGHVEVARMLLGAGANVNAPGSEEYGLMALEGAASYGRLDMVQYLLNAGAKSAYGGNTGYDKAIELAENSSCYAVADLIRDYSQKSRHYLTIQGIVTWQ